LSLRLKLLLISLSTLVLPWAGCQYAREMESALRIAEEQSLSAVAQTMAASLQGREDLLYRVRDHNVAAASEFDLEPVALAGTPVLDGYSEDWPDSAGNWKSFSQPPDYLKVLTGVHERMLYVMLEVHDDRLIFDAQGASAHETDKFGDRIWLGLQNPDGAEHQVLITATSTGPIQARHIETRELGQEITVAEPRIAGAWQPGTQGYRVELRVPLSLLGNQFGVLIDDRDARGSYPQSYGSLRPGDLRTRGRLIAAAPELGPYLTQFLQPGLRIVVKTPRGTALSMANAPAATRTARSATGLQRLYPQFLRSSGERRVVKASAAIRDTRQRHVIGQLEVAQSTDRWLTLRDRALTTLFNFTLIASLIVVMAMFALAAHLALRLSRLRRASESALTQNGLVATFPETGSPDELGDLARSFATLLSRLEEYTSYLRTLAGKLAHEIRTPLTIVRSSLENLELESGPSAAARPYLDRAREGSERLNAILIAMSAATRVEEAIQNSERTRFDLASVIAAAVEAYRSAFPQRKFAIEVPGEPVAIAGAADLIVQLLDKLIENAIDFSPPGSTILVRLAREPEAARLEVENVGPVLAPENRHKIFESLWRSRNDADSRPHFGLGLYIVRLIAELHDGQASAENLPDATGVRFMIRFSLR
jgi:two-component system, OmpR family, sensor histidine kinase ChvG